MVEKGTNGLERRGGEERRGEERRDGPCLVVAPEHEQPRELQLGRQLRVGPHDAQGVVGPVPRSRVRPLNANFSSTVGTSVRPLTVPTTENGWQFSYRWSSGDG